MTGVPAPPVSSPFPTARNRLPHMSSVRIPVGASHLAGTFEVPPGYVDDIADSAAAHSSGAHPPTFRAVLILHGMGGHKDYCYHRQLAAALGERLGVFLLRIDFRGCGDSGDVSDPVAGRTVQGDVEDIRAAVAHLQSGALGARFLVSAVVAHLRGAVAMFEWAAQENLRRQQGLLGVFVPTLVNAAARFTCPPLEARLNRQQPTWRADGGYYLKGIYRNGAYGDFWVPRAETEDLLRQDMHAAGTHVDPVASVLLVFGVEDHIVPITDAPLFANLFGDRHTLVLVPGADHNFYGIKEVTSENASKVNPTGLPLTSRGHVNYSDTVVDHVVEYLREANEVARFRDRTAVVSASPRWKHVDGISNFRDCGGFRSHLVRRDGEVVPAGSVAGTPLAVRAGILYRCANPGGITEQGRAQFAALHVGTVFDLRSAGERNHDGVLDVGTTRNVAAPVFPVDDFLPQAIATRYVNLLTCWLTYSKVYTNMLEKGMDLFRAILRHLVDHPGVPIVFHCTAGKDRTGVVAMLVLGLCGVDRETIAREYALTLIGLRPDFPLIHAKFSKTAVKMELKGADLLAYARTTRALLTEEEAFANLVLLRYEAMLATWDVLEREFGGVERYATERLGLSLRDVAVLRENLLREDVPIPLL